MKKHTLSLDSQTSTSFFIGQNLYSELEETIKKGSHARLLIISDSQIYKHFGQKLCGLKKILPVFIHMVPAGEKAKELAVTESAFYKMLKHSFDRSSAILALGGGAVSDVAGFIASIFMRGIDWYIYPTTLLSQVDASIGGKTAINLGGVKNLIGSYYQPKAVFMDIDTLATLSDRQWRSGMAEVIKYAAAIDKSLFSKLNNKTRQKKHLLEIIYRCFLLKCRIVEKDEKEKTGLRKLLNFGHTLGHAIEKIASFGLYTHGEAVSIGMVLAAKVSQELNLCTSEDVRLIIETLRKFNLPTTLKIKKEPLLKKIISDKKTINQQVRWVLLNGLGKSVGDQIVETKIIKKVLNTL